MFHLRNLPLATLTALAIGHAATTSSPLVVDQDTGISLREGFDSELLHEVPTTQGSWVSMAFDPKGRLIVSDQDDKGAFRVTLPERDAAIKVESLPGFPYEPIDRGKRKVGGAPDPPYPQGSRSGLESLRSQSAHQSPGGPGGDDRVLPNLHHASIMPPGMISAINRDELVDLMAYLLSGGNPDHKAFTVQGDKDGIVPLEDNTALLKQRYEAAGGTCEVKIIPGGGHEISPGHFRVP